MIKLKRQPMKSSKSLQGLTLVELMLGLAIIAILATVVVPGYRDLMRSSELSLETNRFLAALTVARSQAISRGERVTLCKAVVDDDQAAVEDPSECAGTGGYEQGWIIFADQGTLGEFDDGDTLLRVFEEMPVGMTVSGNSNVDDYVSYEDNGLPKTADGAFQAGTFEICKSTYGREIILGAGGRARVEKPDDPQTDYCAEE